MDRAALLADILPPPVPPALPPVPWWSHPLVWLAAAVALLLAGLALWAWRRARVWRHLAAAAAPCARQAEPDPRAAALRLAAALREHLPETQWPPPLRAAMDTLRYAPGGATAAIHPARVAQAVEQAAHRAAWYAWRGRRAAQRAFASALHQATWPVDTGADDAPTRCAAEGAG